MKKHLQLHSYLNLNCFALRKSLPAHEGNRKYQSIDAVEIVSHPLNNAKFWRRLFKVVRSCFVGLMPFSYQMFWTTSFPAFRSAMISARPMKRSPYSKGST